jgi:hypothetical protein
VLPTLMWLYLFVISVLLVNLLIAMMSDTYAKVMDQGRERWTFERAQLITEFKDTKTPLPPPFNVLYVLLVELPAAWRRSDGDEVDVSRFRVVPDLKLLRKIQSEEEEHLKKCIEMQDEREHDEDGWQIRAVSDKVDEMKEATRAQFDTLTRQLEAVTRSVAALSVPSTSGGGRSRWRE